ncbi:elongation factor G|uniref:Elongation factor G n=1 Tax=Dendrosporobacter quercicolus TaxID=146817 RepID=A0A1G9L782_9FIRM|nr:elongation factor G [Dendrosporobacter quercicolus]NSL46619.1 elongation factor G [Dendrosporobacter quercicolus DSM 1736]SDL57607.1 elongation factor G [Dendrosporobacter quercicolus]
MKEYRSSNLRNVAIAAHGGAGKTSLTEALLFNSGNINRLGRVDDGTTITDFEPEEVRRKVTISAALAPCEWRDHKLNFVDTPGYADFVAEVKGVLRAVDSVIITVCAAAGVEVETEKVWRYSEELALPRLVFVNKMDRENADFRAVLKRMRTIFGAGVIPIQLPVGREADFCGVVDLIGMRAFMAGRGNQFTETEIPAEMLEDAVSARQQLVEAAAEMDDDLLIKYLDGDELTTADIANGLRKGIGLAKIFPVMCGSAYRNLGITQLLDAVVEYLPGPETRQISARQGQNELPVTVKSADPFSAVIFKTTADPFVGRLSYIRLFSGSIKADSMIYNASKGKLERVGNIFTLRGKQQEMLQNAYAGDIIVVAKLQETGTGDTLCEKSNPVVFEPFSYPKAMFTMCLEPKHKGDEDKIGPALNRMMDEDPVLKVKKNVETGQLLVSGLGELHLDIMTERIRRKFGVEVVLKPPKVPYRETIRGSVKIEGKHKKQSGGHGQYGHVWLQLDPLTPGANFEFVDSIFGGSVPRQYIPAVEKGVREALNGGVVAGFPMVDVKVTLYDGSYHNVDSSEMAFKIASSLALRKGAMQAKPVLLEPICNVEVEVPEGFMGDIIGDLNGKRGRIQGMEPMGNGLGVVKAQVPMSELFKYPIDLRSITQGRGSFDMSFSHYEEVPQRLAESIIAANSKESLIEA